MIGRTSFAWQTTVADLALILFLVVSAAQADQGDKAARPPASAVLAPVPSAAIFRVSEGTTLAQWLATQALDERQVATVIVSRSAAGASPVMQQGLAFLDEIEASGRSGRLLVERGSADDVTVVLAYDRAPASGMALAAR